MRHPNKDTIYCLSYPRSGSSWFRYCFAFITETEIDKGLLYHSHSIVNDLWTLENTFDIKNILVLRNYKEAIFSEIRNLFTKRSEFPKKIDTRTRLQFTTDLLLSEIIRYALGFDPEMKEWLDGLVPEMNGKTIRQINGDITRAFANSRANFNIQKIINDFLLSDMPIFPADKICDPSYSSRGIESFISSSYITHSYFAIQLKRYYDLLEFYDKISKVNPNNALLIRYEEFIQDPFCELNRVVAFIEKSDLVSFETLERMKDNVNKLNDNLEHHRNISVGKYRARGFLSRGQNEDGAAPDNKRFEIDLHGFHSHYFGCRKEFLIKIDNVLKNKDPELFNKYLSDYEKRVD